MKQPLNNPELLAKLFFQMAINPDGGTISANGNIPENGIAVATKETQNSFNLSGLQKVLEYVADENNQFNYIGYWLHDGKMYFDAVTIIYDRDNAKKIGKEHEQIGIFDIGESEYIELI